MRNSTNGHHMIAVNTQLIPIRKHMAINTIIIKFILSNLSPCSRSLDFLEILTRMLSFLNENFLALQLNCREYKSDRKKGKTIDIPGSYPRVLIDVLFHHHSVMRMN